MLKPEKACTQWERELQEGTQSGLMTKAIKHYPNKLVLIPNSAMEFLCDAEKSQATIFTKFLFCHFPKIMFLLHCCTNLWPLHLRALGSSTVKMKCFEKLRYNKIRFLVLQSSHSRLPATVDLGFNVGGYVCIIEFKSAFMLENSSRRRKGCASMAFPSLMLFKINP